VRKRALQHWRKDRRRCIGAQMAALCDVFVMDAFATAHRAEASTHGVAKYASVACAGRCWSLSSMRSSARWPTPRGRWCHRGWFEGLHQTDDTRNLLDKVDKLILGGGIANTFLAAAGYKVGNSLCETDMIAIARRLLDRAHARGADIALRWMLLLRKSAAPAPPPKDAGSGGRCR